jgi:hypothetical protein
LPPGDGQGFGCEIQQGRGAVIRCDRDFDALERFQAKWRPVRVKKTRQTRNLELRFDFIETENALERIDSNEAFALRRKQSMRMRRNKMTRIFLAVPLVLMVSAASAQSGHPDPGCARDASRHCRAVLNSGDMAVLACLKANRARLSRGCEKVLTDHGQ